MAKVFEWIVRYPGWATIVYASLLGAIWAIPTYLMLRPAPSEHAWEWAKVTVQIGALLLALFGGLVPITKWWEEREQRRYERRQTIMDRKPIVITDCLADGTCEIRNIGAAPATDVWLVLASNQAAVGLGGLDVHQSRRLHDSVVAHLNSNATAAHILIAVNRFRIGPPQEQRHYTVTFNARATDTTFRHAFDDDPPPTRLTRGGTITEYLTHERSNLLQRLGTFVSQSNVTLREGA